MNDFYQKKLSHYIGIDYPIAPFLWSYENFALPYETKSINKLSKADFCNCIKDSHPTINAILDSLTNEDTDFLIHAQYRKEDVYYEGDMRDIYIGFHSLYHYANTGRFDIAPNENYGMYFADVGIFKVFGEIGYSEGYPNKGTHKKNKPGGIDIDSEPSPRAIIVHKIGKIVRFSSVNVCNIYSSEPLLAFISIAKNPYVNDKVVTKKNNKPIYNKRVLHFNGKKNIVTLHILNNIGDNDPNRHEFLELLNRFV